MYQEETLNPIIKNVHIIKKNKTYLSILNPMHKNESEIKTKHT